MAKKVHWMSIASMFIVAVFFLLIGMPSWNFLLFSHEQLFRPLAYLIVTTSSIISIIFIVLGVIMWRRIK